MKCVFWMVVIVASACLLRAEVEVGTSEADLLAEKGKPVGRIKIGERTVYRWSDFEATVVNGAVSKVKFRDLDAEKAERDRRANLAAEAAKAAEGKKLNAKSFLGKVAPEIIVQKWYTEKPDTRGKFILLDFWATWCPPCRRTIPTLNQIQRMYRNDLVVIGLTQENEDEIRKLITPHIEYAIASDPPGNTEAAVGVTGIPHCMIIDPSGLVRWEGFPLQHGYELTPEVVGKIIKDYK